MKTVFCVYKTDSWHSYASRDLIGIATSKEKAISLCHKQARKEHTRISSEQVYNLNNINQTQGYSGNGEFDIEENELDKLY